MRKLLLSLFLVVALAPTSRAMGQTVQSNGATANDCPVLPEEPTSLRTGSASTNVKTSTVVSPNVKCGDPPPGGPIEYPLLPIFTCTPTSLSMGGTVTCTVVLAPGVTSPVTFSANGTLWATATPDASGTATATQALNGNPGTYAMAFDYPGETTGTLIQTIYPPAADTTWVTLTQPPVIVALPPVNALYYFRIADSNSVIGYQANGNIQNYTDSVNGTWTLGYDALNRLVSSQQSPIIASPVYGCWNYDNFGNMLTQAISTASISSSCQTQSGATNLQSSSTYNALNRSTGGTWLDASKVTHTGTPTYDAAGNISNDLVNNYLYDADGKVCAVQSGPGSITGYLYDAEGNRVAKTVLSSFSCDPSAIASVTAEYFIGPDGDAMTEINPTLSGDPWVRTEVSAAGQYLATYKPDGVHYQITDWLGTKRMQINPNNTLNPDGIEESCSSYPFGDQLNCDAPLDASSRHFSGKERDAESGLDYFGARYYASSMGRFMSPDWAENPEAIPYSHLDDPQSLNLYGFLKSNPLSSLDKDGHEGTCPVCMLSLTEEAIEIAAQHPETVSKVLAGISAASTESAEVIGGALERTVLGVGAALLYSPPLGGGPGDTLVIKPKAPNDQTKPDSPKPITPPVPVSAEHTKNPRRSTKDKHEKVRPGTSPPPNYIPDRQYKQPKDDKKKEKKKDYVRKDRDTPPPKK